MTIASAAESEIAYAMRSPVGDQTASPTTSFSSARVAALGVPPRDGTRTIRPPTRKVRDVPSGDHVGNCSAPRDSLAMAYAVPPSTLRTRILEDSESRSVSY